MVEDGKMSEKDYKRWRQSAMVRTDAWKDLRDTLASDLSHTNEIAMSMINDHAIDCYALNMNYGTYEIENGYHIGTSFSMYDHRTVENLMKEDPQIIPKAGLDIPEDKRWNRQKLTSAITQGILTGDSIPDIAKRLGSVADMNAHAAVRNARTYTTAAENKGRTDSYERAQNMGIELEQEWLATLDQRTRSSHVHMDGERVKIGAKFSNGCRYPGDPAGRPEEIYNCRCTLVAALKGYDYQDDRFSRLPAGMTYEEWKAEAEKRNAPEKSFADRVHKIMDKSLKNSGQLSQDDIKAIGKIFAGEVEKDYLGPINKEIEDAQKQLDALGAKEIDDLDRKCFDIRKIRRGLMDPEELGYSSRDEALAEYTKALSRIDEIKNNEAYSKAEARLAKAELALNDRPAHRAFMRNKIGEVREVGIGDLDVKGHLMNSRSPVRKSIEEAYDCYPHAWVQRSVDSGFLKPKKVDRGYYDNYNKEIAISGREKESQLETAIHELGHRYERVVPGIREQEKEFYERRTAGEPLQWLGYGYSRSEVSRKDDFLHPYMGKDYGGFAYELVSMGFEYAYTDPARLAKDPDMQEWILGMLLSL